MLSLVELTVTRIAVTVRERRAVLFPEHHQRHIATLQLLMHLRPVGSRASRALVKASRREQPSLQLRIADLRRDRPCNADHFGTRHELADRRLANTRGVAHLSDAEPQLVRQTQNLANLPHRHSHPRHRLPRCSWLTGGPIS